MMITTTDAPAPVQRFLAADEARDSATVAASFALAATLIDEGHASFGRAVIVDWRDGPASEWTYTQQITEAGPTGPNAYALTAHLEDDVPGGVVDLHHRFAVLDNQIVHPTIEP